MGFWNLTLLCLFFCLGKGINIHSRGVCTSRSWTYYCCRGFVRNGTECVECPMGYFSSLNEWGCNPCVKGTYGRRCSEICACNETERCDHVRGCVRDAEIEDYVTFETSAYTDSTTSMTSFHHHTGGYNVTVTSKRSHGIMTRDLIMYLLTPTFLIVFIIVIVYLRRRQTRGGDIQSPDVEAVYHTIDDNTLNDHLPTNQDVFQEPLDNNEDKDGKRISEGDGADAEEESSSEVGEENILDYLNPYQPVLMINRQNEYATISTEIANNSSAESDTDSYLNPYQSVRKRSEHGEENSDSRIVITLRRNEATTTGDESKTCSIGSDKSYQSYNLENRECSSTSDESYQIYYLKH